jgi:hypothetical protein
MANHKTAAEFVGVLLHSSTATHFLHLQTASYAAHKALGHYYENIIDLADKYAEAYQGHFGIIPLNDYPDGFKVQADAAKYANSLLTFVKGIRKDLPQETDLQNIIDEIVGEISALIYKLERFK